MLRTLLNKSASAAAKPNAQALAFANLFPPTNIEKTPVYPNHTIPVISTTPEILKDWYTKAKKDGYLDRKDHWAVVDAFGIPSAGAGLKLQYLSSKGLVEQGIPQMSLQLLPFAPRVEIEASESKGDGEGQGILVTELLAPGSLKLTEPEHTPYVLSRSNNGTDFVGGVYMRLFRERQDVILNRGDITAAKPVAEKVAEQVQGKQEQSGFMKELGDLVARRFFSKKG